MTRLRGLLCGAGAALGLAAAAAAVPPVFDRVPTNSLMVVSVPSLERVNKAMDLVKANIAVPLPIPSVQDMLKMGGLEKGVDLSKSIAIVTLPDAAPKADAAGAEQEPNVVVLVPTGDYKALLKNFEKEPGPAGSVDQVQVNGQDVFIKPVGDGYVVVGPMKDTVAGFEGKAGNLKAHETALGAACNAVADASDLVIFVNVPSIKAQPGKPIKERFREAMENSPMGMMAGGDENAFAGIEAAIESFMNNARAGIVGVKVDASGVAVDAVAQFAEGTDAAKSFAKESKAAGLVQKLPKQDYLFAFAADLSDQAMKSRLKNWTSAAGGDKAIQFDKLDGISGCLGFSPAMLAPGAFFSGTVFYGQSKAGDDYIASFKSALADLNGKTVEKLTFTTNYNAGATKSGDTPVDSWSLKMAPAGDDESEAAGALMAMFGSSGGPTGYIAKADGGFVQTMAKNSMLLTAALDAARGNNSLKSDTLLSQVGEKLPAGRMGELYVGVKTMLDMAKIAIAQFGGDADFEVPDAIPPVGLALTGSGGAARSTIFVPMPVIKAVSEVAKAMQAAQGGGMEDHDDAGGGKDPGTGQPKF